MAIHAAHLIGGGLWIGGLFVLFVDLVTRRQGTAPLQLFAPVALTGSATIALSGLIAAALYVGLVILYTMFMRGIERLRKWEPI